MDHLSKGSARHLRQALYEIKDTFVAEAKAKDTWTSRNPHASIEDPITTQGAVQPQGAIQRGDESVCSIQNGKYRLLECFSTNDHISKMAQSLSTWTVLPLVAKHLPEHYSLLDRFEACNPDLVLIHCPLQLASLKGMRTPYQIGCSRKMQEDTLRLLAMSVDALCWQWSRGKPGTLYVRKAAALMSQSPLIDFYCLKGVTMIERDCDSQSHITTNRWRPRDQDQDRDSHHSHSGRDCDSHYSHYGRDCDSHYSHYGRDCDSHYSRSGRESPDWDVIAFTSDKFVMNSENRSKLLDKGLLDRANDWLDSYCTTVLPTESSRGPTGYSDERSSEEGLNFEDCDPPDNNWSDQELPPAVRHDIMARVPKVIRREARRQHNGLGHPSEQASLRMLRLGNASDAASKYAQHWQCPVCESCKIPHPPLEASPSIAPFGFNRIVSVDSKYLLDSEGGHHISVSLVCTGTCFHGRALLKSRQPQHAIQHISQCRTQVFGAPEMFILDQGGEFEAEFNQTLDEYDIDSTVVGSHAPWQHGFAERHGGILGSIWHTVCKQHHITGRDKVKLALACCFQAKNAILTRNGMSPEQAAFGKCLRWPESVNKDDDKYALAALGSDGEAWLSSQIRATARMAMVARDANDKLRRALIRKAPKIVGDIAPGTVVNFWTPHPLKGRRRNDPEHWRRPATVVVRQSPGRHYISWRGKIKLLAKDQIRGAPPELQRVGTTEKSVV